MTQVESAERSLDELVKKRRAEIARDAKWYVLEAREAKDFGVCCRLAAAGFEVFRPVDKVTVTRRVRVGGVLKQQKVNRNIPRFGRFLFLHTRMSVWVRAAIEQYPDVVGFMRSAGTEELAVMSDALIEFYREEPRSKVIEDGVFGVGDRVRIAIGPASGVFGVVRFCERRACRMEMRDGDRVSTLFVPFDHLELVEKARGVPHGNRKSRRADGRPSRYVNG